MLKDNKHEFALFYPDLSLQKHQHELAIVDKNFIQRVTSVLRLKEGDQVVLFDRQIHAQAVLGTCTRKKCLVVIKQWSVNTELKPNIVVLLPVLKRDALESAIYSSVALGASTIQLIATEKTRKWQGEKELERSNRIIVAAAEQSKHFIFPDIKEPIDLISALELYKDSSNKLFADPEGVPCLKALAEMDAKKEFLLFVGPEGDLTSAEKKILENQFVFCKLTPTILKSEHAIALLLGTIRIAT